MKNDQSYGPFAGNAQKSVYPDPPLRIFGIGILLHEGGEWPRWYGFAYRQFQPPYRAICFPIPLNVIVGFPVAVYWWLKRPWRVTP